MFKFHRIVFLWSLSAFLTLAQSNEIVPASCPADAGLNPLSALPASLTEPECLAHFFDDRLFTRYHAHKDGERQWITAPKLSQDAISGKLRCFVGLMRKEHFWASLTDFQSMRSKRKAVVIFPSAEETWTQLRNLTEAEHYNFDIYAVVPGNCVNSTTAMYAKTKYTRRYWLHASPSASSGHSQLVVRAAPASGPLKVAYVNFPPFGVVEGDGNLSGIDVDIWKIVIEKLGIDAKFVEAPFIGAMPNMVRDGSADATAFELLYHTNWIPGNDLSPATCYRTFFFATGLPKKVNQYLTILEPFSWQVWIAVLTAVAAIYTSLLLTNRVYPISRDSFVLANVAVGVMINEGIPNRLLIFNKHSKTMQVLLIIWIPMSCLIGMAYQSNLLSVLVKSSFEDPINTYEDVMTQGLKIYLLEGTIVGGLLKTTPFEIVKEAVDKLGVWYTQTNNSAPTYIWDDVTEGKAVMDLTISRLFGRRHYIREPESLDIGSFPCGFYYGMNNPVETDSDRIIMQMVDTGITKHIVDSYYYADSAPEREFFRFDNSDDWTELGQTHMLPIWILLGLFLGVTVIAFGLEMIKQRYDKRNGKRQPFFNTRKMTMED